MNHFPILQELFESDLVILLLISMAAAFLFGIRKPGKPLRLLLPLGFYLLCEFAAQLPGSYTLEIIALFLGVIALGCFLGSAVCHIIRVLRRRSGH